MVADASVTDIILWCAGFLVIFFLAAVCIYVLIITVIKDWKKEETGKKKSVVNIEQKIPRNSALLCSRCKNEINRSPVAKTAIFKNESDFSKLSVSEKEKSVDKSVISSEFSVHSKSERLSKETVENNDTITIIPHNSNRIGEIRSKEISSDTDANMPQISSQRSEASAFFMNEAGRTPPVSQQNSIRSPEHANKVTENINPKTNSETSVSMTSLKIVNNK